MCTSCSYVPEANAFVVRARREGFAVRRPCQGVDAREVAFKGVLEGARGGRPDLDGGIGRAAGYPQPVWRELEARDASLVATKDEVRGVVQ